MTPGIWSEEQVAGWKKVTDAVHAAGGKIVSQLWHVGRFSSVELQPGGAAPVAPSAIKAEGSTYTEKGFVEVSMPRALETWEIPGIIEQYRLAAENAKRAGFDGVEVHSANSYLLDQFLRDSTNQRTDRYGGSIENRARFPAEAIQAVRAIMPAGMPLSVRISASDWAQGGLSDDDLIATARALHEAGADVLDVSTGQTVPWQKPVYGRMYQTPFSDFIRNTLNVPTIAVGNIYEPDHVNSIVASGRADLCAVARPHLANPSWTLQAAAQLQHSEQWWPQQYLSGKSQLERNLQRAALLAGVV